MTDTDLEHRGILGFEMYLDPDDPGLSHDLKSDGVREPFTSNAYRNALFWGDVDVVVDIGANIGYYALQPASFLGSDVDVVAIEPDESNAELLRKNVALNGFEESVTVVESAVGASDGTETLYRHEKSNLHTMNPAKPGTDAGVEVETRRVETILSDLGIPPERVDVVRMDIEGFEAQALRGMQSIFEAAETPLLCNIEFHPILMDEADEAFLHAVFATENVERVYSVAQAGAQAVAKDVEAALGWNWMEVVFEWDGEWPED